MTNQAKPSAAPSTSSRTANAPEPAPFPKNVALADARLRALPPLPPKRSPALR